MKNELSNYKKKVSRSFWIAWAFFVTLIITVLGLLLYYLFYILAPDLQLSPVTEKLFFCVILIFLLIAFLVGKFWYIPAIMKVSEVYMNTNRFNKETKMFSIFNNRTYAVSICLTVFISILIGFSFWYFVHLPAQKILNAEPVKKYNTVTPLKPKNQSSKTPGTITSHSHQEDILEADAPSDQKQSNLRENTDQSRDTSVSEKKEEVEHKHLQSKEEQEASKKLKAEAEAVLELAKQSQKESLELMREAMPIVVNHLNTLSQDEQRELLQQTKTTMANQISQYPSELQPFIEEFNIVEEGWRMYLDMLAEYGYTPPKGIE
ncbi:hypothetical protein C6497_05580 [Candidatus Poribacteria bacterium]|nr:MAG: hypothetical protein C6497_05580 [Candidatus Poribacteria bacterium]